MLRADERMNPVYDYKVDQCGAVYINVGDGGNIGELFLCAVCNYRCITWCSSVLSALYNAHLLRRLQRASIRTTSTTLACAQIPSPASVSRKWCAPNRDAPCARCCSTSVCGGCENEKM